MTQCGDKRNVWILWTYDQAADGVSVGEANEVPGLPGVDGFVDAVTADDVATDAGFPCSDIDDVGVGLGDGDSAALGTFEKMIAVGRSTLSRRRPLTPTLYCSAEPQLLKGCVQLMALDHSRSRSYSVLDVKPESNE